MQNLESPFWVCGLPVLVHGLPDLQGSSLNTIRSTKSESANCGELETELRSRCRPSVLRGFCSSDIYDPQSDGSISSPSGGRGLHGSAPERSHSTVMKSRPQISKETRHTLLYLRLQSGFPQTPLPPSDIHLFFFPHPTHTGKASSCKPTAGSAHILV